MMSYFQKFITKWKRWRYIGKWTAYGISHEHVELIWIHKCKECIWSVCILQIWAHLFTLV